MSRRWCNHHHHPQGKEGRKGEASNYGLNLNASQGIGIQAYDPKTGQYNSYTMNGLYDGYINSKKTMRFSDTTGLTPSPAQVSHRATTCRFPMLPTSIPHSFL